MGASIIARLRPRQHALSLLGLLLLWPAAVNGGAFLFADTSAYVRGPDAAVLRATGHATAWSNDEVLRVAAPTRSAAPANHATPAPAAKPVLLGRSVFYGALPYAGALAGSFWVTIVLQALLAGAVIVGFTRHFRDPADERRFAATVALTTAALATTPLAWFTSMAMPDLLTGIAVVAAAALVAGWQRETRAGRLFWLAVATYAALAHSSHVLILLALALLALAVGFMRLPAWRPGGWALLAVAAVGLAGEAGFVAGVRALTGTAPIRPPFITARLVEDGPGLAWLDAHCAERRFLLCRYRERLPLGSDAFLWSERPTSGVFKTLPPAEQRALAAEQTAFVAAVIADRPLDVAASTVTAIARQVGAWGLSEFNYPPSESRGMLKQMPAAERATFIATRAYRRQMPTGPAVALMIAWSLAGAAAIALACRHRETRAAGRYGLVLVAGWIVDIVLCGALSTPHERYQARVLWVLAFAAITLGPLLLRRQSHASARLAVSGR